MRIFKTKQFDKLAGKVGLIDAALIKAAKEVATGLAGDALGGNLYKKRIARIGAGKSRGYRTVLIYRTKPQDIFFIYCFAKNERSNVGREELIALRLLEKEFSNFSNADIDTAIREGELSELTYEDE
ncbi:MAG: type II toxin-antitoxin system RelE/ParE family toxin [Candidatus Obscuribacterales bacterium]